LKFFSLTNNQVIFTILLQLKVVSLKDEELVFHFTRHQGITIQ